MGVEPGLYFEVGSKLMRGGSGGFPRFVGAEKMREYPEVGNGMGGMVNQ